MKKLSRLLAVLLALLLTLNAFALAEETTPDSLVSENPEAESQQLPDDTVIFTIYDISVTKAEVNQVRNQLVVDGFIEDPQDYDTVIDYMIEQFILEHKIKELGLDVFTEEEEAAFLADAQAQWESMLDNYVSYFLTEDTDEAWAETRQQAEAYYTANGASVEKLCSDLKFNASCDLLLIDGLMNGLNATEEEIQALFSDWAEQSEQLIGDDIGMYEAYQYYGQLYGDVSYLPLHQPAGYRGILHILLNTDQTLLNAYLDAQAAYEETLSGEEDATTDTETTTSESVTKEQVDAAYAALLANHQATIDEIYGKLESGESFESLIAQYGIDPGMQDAENLAKGYAVHKDSVMWDPAFVTGAFSEKMTKPGDVSDPVVGTNGIHILYYLRDIPEGRIEMTDELHDYFQEAVLNQKWFEAYQAAWEAWELEAQVVYNQEAIDTLKAMPVEEE